MSKTFKKEYKNLKAVSINNLSHSYGKDENKKKVLNNVNFFINGFRHKNNSS